MADEPKVASVKVEKVENWLGSEETKVTVVTDTGNVATSTRSDEEKATQTAVDKALNK